MEDMMMMKRKLRYTGHLLRGSSGLSHLPKLEGYVPHITQISVDEINLYYVEEKRKVGGLRRTWMKDIIEWTGLGNYKMVKRTVKERKSWKLIVVNLHFNYDEDK